MYWKGIFLHFITLCYFWFNFVFICLIVWPPTECKWPNRNCDYLIFVAILQVKILKFTWLCIHITACRHWNTRVSSLFLICVLYISRQIYIPIDNVKYILEFLLSLYKLCLGVIYHILEWYVVNVYIWDDFPPSPQPLFSIMVELLHGGTQSNCWLKTFKSFYYVNHNYFSLQQSLRQFGGCWLRLSLSVIYYHKLLIFHRVFWQPTWNHVLNMVNMKWYFQLAPL